MDKCIVIPDSFKGTMSSTEVSNIVKEEILNIFPKCNVRCIPIADGGEGTVEAFLQSLSNGKKVTLSVSGPYMEKMDVSYAVFEDTAVIEMASCAGLPLVENCENPLLTTTYGVGEQILHVINNYPIKRVILGLGGSCTNDAGCGCAAALGAIFKDNEGNDFIPTGGSIDKIKSIDISQVNIKLKGIQIIAMCDVNNPMHGITGAAHIFAPQKGADSATVLKLDENLKFLDELLKKQLGKAVGSIKGTGAAGAFGAGIIALMGGCLQSGIETILDMVKFDDELKDTNLVITGEGRLDSQTLSGKVIMGIAKRAAYAGVPVTVIAGAVEEDIDEIYSHGVSAVFSINRKPLAFEDARKYSEKNLAFMVGNIMKLLKTVK
jgi:glycerate kinase